MAKRGVKLLKNQGIITQMRFVQLAADRHRQRLGFENFSIEPFQMADVLREGIAFEYPLPGFLSE
jgi:hypothetical protein